ncbi:MAG: helix-turn-helix transcriptional regulator [Ruminococcaceae bacterium]|nr:helix-turn-helix transcriptional regulator [Oscillospiraceae bacterium]
MVFRQRLQQLREKRRVSRRVASELCGLHSDAFRRYERGEAEPTLHALVAIAEYFEVSVDYLFPMYKNFCGFHLKG